MRCLWVVAVLVAAVGVVEGVTAADAARGHAQPAGASFATVTVSVPGTTTFLKTGVTLRSGETAVISATGTISYGSLDPRCQGIPITSEGCAAETICQVAGGCGALIGRLGGKAFFIGKRKTVKGPGTLWLGINDNPGAFGDNSGAFSVTVKTAGPETKPPKPESLTAVATVVEIKAVGPGPAKAEYYSDGRWRPLTIDFQLKPYVRIRTDGNTIAALEFAIGGRVGLNKGSELRVVGDRKVARARLEAGGMWAKCQKLEQPLEIQTKGGVTGIKG